MSAKIDTTPDYPEQPASLVEAAERDLPSVLQDMSHETGNGADAPGHGHRVVLAEKLVEAMAGQKGHAKAAAAWAVHRLAERGLLRCEVAREFYTRVVGQRQVPGRVMFGVQRYREEPVYDTKEVPLAETAAGPVPYGRLLLYSTDQLWVWWRSLEFMNPTDPEMESILRQVQEKREQGEAAERLCQDELTRLSRLRDAFQAAASFSLQGHTAELGREPTREEFYRAWAEKVAAFGRAIVEYDLVGWLEREYNPDNLAGQWTRGVLLRSCRTPEDVTALQELLEQSGAEQELQALRHRIRDAGELLLKEASTAMSTPPASQPQEITMPTGRHDRDWTDTMQVCERGHLITLYAESQPGSRKKRCPECGAATLIACPKCGNRIPGYRHLPRVVYMDNQEPPSFCENCGEAYPWTPKEALVPTNHGREVPGGGESRKASFSWLHLTDLHFGMSGQKWLWPNIREEFFRDLERLHRKSGPWDLVLFTGDFVQKGGADEFEGLNELLVRLWDHLRGLGSVPYLLGVPGNHDLVRPNPSDAAVAALRTGWNDTEVQREFWGNPKSGYRRMVKKAFKNYLAWWDSLTLPRLDSHSPGVLPGDFSATLEKGGVKLGVVGLNTTFLQLEGGDYEGRLAVSPPQLHLACGGDGVDWVKGRQVCLLLTHQPPIWLTPESRRDFNGEIAKPGRFAAHLFGHMHEAAARSLSQGGADARREWQGCSLFGLEEWGEAGGRKKRLHGYAAGRIEVEGDQGTIRQWPRLAAPHQAEHLHIVPDHSFTLMEDGGTRPEPVAVVPTPAT